MIDGFKVICNDSFSLACECSKGNDGHQCKHGEDIDAYLKVRKTEQEAEARAMAEQEAQPAKAPTPRGESPLSGTGKPFSLLRR